MEWSKAHANESCAICQHFKPTAETAGDGMWLCRQTKQHEMWGSNFWAQRPVPGETSRAEQQPSTAGS